MSKCSHEVCFVFKTLFYTLLKLKILRNCISLHWISRSTQLWRQLFLFSKSCKDSTSQIISLMIRNPKYYLLANSKYFLIISSEFVKDWNNRTERITTTVHTWSKEKSEQLWIYFFHPTLTLLPGACYKFCLNRCAMLQKNYMLWYSWMPGILYLISSLTKIS